MLGTAALVNRFILSGAALPLESLSVGAVAMKSQAVEVKLVLLWLLRGEAAETLKVMDTVQREPTG